MPAATQPFNIGTARDSCCVPTRIRRPALMPNTLNRTCLPYNLPMLTGTLVLLFCILLAATSAYDEDQLWIFREH